MKQAVEPQKRCAVYTRKSTSVGLEQEFNSLDAQRERCVAYATSQGWTVAGTYDDGGFTGANIERPAFQRLLADAEAGLIDVVVVYKVDRLSRSLLDFAKVMDRLGRAGASFVSVTQNFSTADAMGRLTLNMLMSFAEFEREMIGERTRDKVAAARRKGKWTGGTVPLGYDVVDKKLVLNEAEAEIVREIFALYDRDRSALVVMKELRARGRRAKKGAFTKDGVLRVLRNPLYAGLIACGEDLCDGEHEAIVTRATFERAGSRLRGRIGSTPFEKNPEYLLRGLLRCGSCGGSMTPAGTRAYRYYRCVTRDKQGKEACPSRPLSAPAIERYVVERIQDAACDASFIEDVVRELEARLAIERKTLMARRDHLEGELERLGAEAEGMLDASRTVRGPARSLAQERFERIACQQQEVQEAAAESADRLGEVEEISVEAAWVAEMLPQFGTVWDAMTKENRRRLVVALVDRVVIKDATGEAEITMAPVAREKECA